MNSRLDLLRTYPFERLRRLLDGATPGGSVLDLTIGEPKHPTPDLIRDAITANLNLLGGYPAAKGTPELRAAIAGWLGRRYGAAVDPETGVLPVSGTREALFAFAQAVVDPADPGVVLMPNPFYLIYEGAALLAGAEPVYVPATGQPDWSAVPADVWPRVRLAYVCSPGNPSGAALDLDGWREVFALADRWGFVIAADECYSEIYRDAPPVGALEAARILGRGVERLVVFNSLSKRSSAPGLRSGFVAGDPAILARFLLYRTYHGAAPSLVFQAASVAAWSDEAHVAESREKYRAKFAAVARRLETDVPEGGFFLWWTVPGGDDEAFALDLFRATGVRVLPGSYVGRETAAGNPGRGFARIALVPELGPVVEAADRIAGFTGRG